MAATMSNQYDSEESGESEELYDHFDRVNLPKFARCRYCGKGIINELRDCQSCGAPNPAFKGGQKSLPKRELSL